MSHRSDLRPPYARADLGLFLNQELTGSTRWGPVRRIPGGLVNLDTFYYSGGKKMVLCSLGPSPV